MNAIADRPTASGGTFSVFSIISTLVISVVFVLARSL